MNEYRPVSALSLSDVKVGDEIVSYIPHDSSSLLEYRILEINDVIEKGETDHVVTIQLLNEDTILRLSPSSIGLAHNSDGTLHRTAGVKGQEERWAIPRTEPDA